MVPDLFAVLPAGLTTAQVSAISGLTGVRAVLAVDGGQVVINGRAASMLGVPSQAFRSWTPPATAVAVSVTAVTDVALAATAIWACTWYAAGDSEVSSDPIVHVADPFPPGQRAVNRAA